MKPPMNTEQPSRNQKLGDPSCLRAFVVKAGPNPPRRREDTKNDLKLLYARARMPAVSSSGVTEAVPSLPTTMPAAILERTAASRTVSPATRPRARVEMTVSPAPVTSKTSRATVGMCVTRESPQTGPFPLHLASRADGECLSPGEFSYPHAPGREYLR